MAKIFCDVCGRQIGPMSELPLRRSISVGGQGVVVQFSRPAGQVCLFCVLDGLMKWDLRPRQLVEVLDYRRKKK